MVRFERSEEEVGISIFLTNHPRFKAKIKERFSHFHVNEIDPEGNVVHLTSFDVPKDATEVVTWDDIEKFLPQTKRTEVEEIVKGVEVIIDVDGISKEERSRVHGWIKGFKKLSSETGERDGKKVIIVKEKSGGRSRRDRRPAGRAKYTHCVLYKEGADSSDVVAYIAKKLNINPNLIGIAGTKDKQAISSQRISIPNIDAKRLAGISSLSKCSKIGNFSYKEDAIQLGNLTGNQFRLLLTQIENEEAIACAVESLTTKGFINYFGLQRFGSYITPTHAVGRAVVRSAWKEAIDLILSPVSNDQKFMRDAKEAWRNGNYSAYDNIPHTHRSIEASLLHGIKKFPNDLRSAFSQIQRNVRKLYVHSFQSYVWNKAASERIKLSLSALPGDLIEDEKGNVRVLGEGEEASISDVVLPLLGPSVILPQNTSKDYMEKLLADEGISIDSFSKADGSSGAYRRIVVIPSSVSWRLFSYSDSDPMSLDSFIPSDLALLEGKHIESEGEGNQRGMVLALSLPSSAYATMALREILIPSKEAENDEPNEKKAKLADNE